jgi:hypothetical protein
LLNHHRTNYSQPAFDEEARDHELPASAVMVASIGFCRQPMRITLIHKMSARSVADFRAASGRIVSWKSLIESALKSEERLESQIGNALRSSRAGSFGLCG